jgi:hypothetical protein
MTSAAAMMVLTAVAALAGILVPVHVHKAKAPDAMPMGDRNTEHRRTK